MIHLTYQFNQSIYNVCDNVVQWDTGQVLKITNLPQGCKYSLAYSKGGSDIITKSELIKNSVIPFPDECFFESGIVHCYIQQENEGSRRTIADISIFIKERIASPNTVNKSEN